MSIIAAELIAFGVANIPTDDSGTSGGAIDLTMRPVFTQFTASAQLALISDGTDTRSVHIVGRLASGASAAEDVSLTSTSEVLSANTYERILSVKAATTDASRTVTLKQGTGGTTIATIPPNEKGVYAMFQNSASDVGAVTRYEKLFWKNTNGTLTLTSAQITLTADPSTRIRIALETAVNGTGSTTNRLTSPTGIGSFTDNDIAINCPSNQLNAGEAEGVWVEQALQAADGAFRSSFSTKLSGQTT